MEPTGQQLKNRELAAQGLPLATQAFETSCFQEPID